MKVSPHSNTFRKIIAAHKRATARQRERQLEQFFASDEFVKNTIQHLFPIRCTSFNHQPQAAPRSCAANSAGDVSTSVVGVPHPINGAPE